MKRINLSFTENIYKKNEAWEVLFDENGNWILEETKKTDFVLTFNIDENITVKQMQVINKSFSWMEKWEEIEWMIKMIEEFAIEKENIKFIDKLWVAEFTKLNEFIAWVFNNISENTQKKIVK